MGAYLIRRLLLVIPTLWAIITINFFIVQIAPGGPVDQAIAAIHYGRLSPSTFSSCKLRLAVRSTRPSPPLSLVMPEYYPAQAVKVFAPAMRKRASVMGDYHHQLFHRANCAWRSGRPGHRRH